MRAGARESRLRASERPPGGVGGARGELAGKTRPPGRVPGAAVRLLGARAPAPVGNGGCPPQGRTVGPVAPDPAAKTGNARRAGGCGPCPVDNLWQHGNMATWHRGIVATWQHGIVAPWVPFAFSVWGSSGSIGHTLKANGTTLAQPGSELAVDDGFCALEIPPGRIMIISVYEQICYRCISVIGPILERY